MHKPSDNTTETWSWFFGSHSRKISLLKSCVQVFLSSDWCYVMIATGIVAGYNIWIKTSEDNKLTMLIRDW